MFVFTLNTQRDTQQMRVSALDLGAAIGPLAAVPLSRSMRALLFEAPPFDLATFSLVALALVTVAALAS
jgi:hypothetical protein